MLWVCDMRREWVMFWRASLSERFGTRRAGRASAALALKENHEKNHAQQHQHHLKSYPLIDIYSFCKSTAFDITEWKEDSCSTGKNFICSCLHCATNTPSHQPLRPITSPVRHYPSDGYFELLSCLDRRGQTPACALRTAACTSGCPWRPHVFVGRLIQVS